MSDKEEVETPAEEEEKPSKKAVKCPVKVIYCGVCSLPPEYCEYQAEPDKCKQWLQENVPDLFEKLTLNDGSAGAGEEDKKKRQKRGGKGVVKAKKKAEPQKITITRATRNKKKFVTVIKGLSTHEIDMKKASKAFANRFSCGSSVTGEDEIVIQGDVTDDIIDFILEKFQNIDDDSIEYLGDAKR